MAAVEDIAARGRVKALYIYVLSAGMNSTFRPVSTTTSWMAWIIDAVHCSTQVAELSLACVTARKQGILHSKYAAGDNEAHYLNF